MGKSVRKLGGEWSCGEKAIGFTRESCMKFAYKGAICGVVK